MPEDTGVQELNRLLDLSHQQIGAYQRAQASIAVISLAAIRVATEAAYPGAKFLVVEESDQPGGGLWVDEEGTGILDGDGERVEYGGTALFPWADVVEGPLSNLDDRVVEVWEPFVQPNTSGRVLRLELERLADINVDEALAEIAATADECADCGNGPGGVYGTIVDGRCAPCRLGRQSGRDITSGFENDADTGPDYEEVETP